MLQSTVLSLVLLFVGHIGGGRGHSVEPGRTKTLPARPTFPTVVYTCSSGYIRYINSRANMSTEARLGGLPNMVYGFIETLCRNDTGYGRKLVTCMYNGLPYSTYPIDKILVSSLNLTTLSQILHGGCSLLTELQLSLECIISTVMESPTSLTCMQEVRQFFDSIISSGVTMATQNHVNTFCSTWGILINCLAPYIAVCSETLTDKWAEYGSLILSPACHRIAFVQPEENVALEGSSVDLHELFGGNSSAVVTCARQYSPEMVEFMPTSVFNHSVHPSEVVINFKSVCGEKIQSFMYCMDEKRLNMSSPMDDFMFQIISTVNMRVSYNKLCSKLDVLNSNINCLLNSALEMKQCTCFIHDLLEKVHVLSTQATPFSYEKIIQPFCGSYVSFVECYVGLLSTCSVDLGYLMNDVYLGVLTSTCLNANMTSCSAMVPTVGGSEFLQCGEKVAMYLTNVSRNSTMTEHMEYIDMIQQMQDLVRGLLESSIQWSEQQVYIEDAYGERFLRYFLESQTGLQISIGTEILICMKDKMLPSQSPFDRLLKMMFDVNKFRTILMAGCDLTLIKDVKSRLKFILSTMMSNPETSVCIDAMSRFSDVLKGQVDIDGPETVEPYCRVWADFSECIESQLACSSPELVDKWRAFTIDSMTPACYEIAIDQQRMNQFSLVCTVDQITDSAMSICGLEYMIPYQERSAARNPILDQTDMVIMEEIDHFCNSHAHVGQDIILCLRTTVPASYLPLDRAVSHTYDFTVLDDVLKKACALRPVLKSHMACIVDTVQKSDPNDKCVHNLIQAFNLTSSSKAKFPNVLSSTCRAWNTFVHCVDPHISKCSHGISHKWRELSFEVLSSSCKEQTSSTRQYRSHATVTIPSITLLSMGALLFMFCAK